MAILAFNIDPSHSQIHLELDHLEGVGVLTARFAGLRGELRFDEASDSVSFDLSADARSVSSALATLDPALVGKDMFDVERFPVLGLKVPSASGASSAPPVKATLTIREVAVETDVSIRSLRTIKHPRGHQVVGVRGYLELLRSDFGIDVAKIPTLRNKARLFFAIEATAG